MATFRINYLQVVNKANDIRSLADDLNREIRTLENLLADVKNNWRGPASEAYQKQLLMLIADMKTTKFDMTSLSSTIKNTASKIQSEDERLAEQAEQQLFSSGGGGGGGGGGRSF